MDVTFFAADPYARDELGGETHEPTVGVGVGSTRLTAHLRSEVKRRTAQTVTRTGVDNVEKNGKDFVVPFFGEHLILPRMELGDNITVGIGNSGHEHRFDVHTLVGKSGISAYHLAHRNVAWTETEREHGIDMVSDAEIVHVAHEGGGL